MAKIISITFSMEFFFSLLHSYLQTIVLKKKLTEFSLLSEFSLVFIALVLSSSDIFITFSNTEWYLFGKFSIEVCVAELAIMLIFFIFTVKLFERSSCCEKAACQNDA